MDTAHWPQGIGVVKPMDQGSNNNKGMLERSRTRPQKDQALNCPRCNSTNTKFCYYNNYSLSQPRYFCKTCRRYWTEGGSLRNVPVGGGSRKNKRSSSSSSSISGPITSTSSSPNLLFPSSANKKAGDHHQLISASQNPKIHQAQDLNLAYPPTTDHDSYDNNNISRFVEVNPYINDNKSHHHQNPTTTTTSSSHLSAMELLKTSGIINGSRGLMSSFMAAMPPHHHHVVPDSSNTMFSLAAQEFKPNPSLSFDLDHHQGYDHHHGYGGNLHHHHHENGAKLLFPNDQDLKQVSTSTTTTTTNIHQFEQINRGQGDSTTTGYWNGMLGGGSW